MSNRTLTRGQQIDTTRGRATVLEVRASDVVVHLAEEKRYATIPIVELFPRNASANGVRRTAMSEAGERSRVSAEQRTLEALRFGLVPVEGLEELTIGYDDLRNWTISRLPGSAGKPMVSEVSGPFGTGKSHSMAVIRHVARQEGYVTAHVEVDGLNISLSDPEKVLYSLWRTLRGEGLDSSTPLLELYLGAIGRNQQAPMMNPQGQDRIWNNYRAIRFLKQRDLIDALGYDMDCVVCSASDEILASEVERKIRAAAWGFDSKVMKMIGRRVDERPDDFVESLAGHAMVAKLAGYKGLVVTIDEFEVEWFLSHERKGRVRALLLALMCYLTDVSPIRAAPLSIFFATVGQENHRGDAAVDAVVKAAGGAWYDLREFSEEDQRKLAGRIFSLYKRVYGMYELLPSDLPTIVLNELSQDAKDSGATRAFIKHFMGALDSYYGPPVP